MKKTLLLLTAGLLLWSGNLLAEEVVIPRFDVKQLFLEGNTILPPQDVAAILKKHTGPQKDFGTLQQAMDELEAAYRKRGYTMVTVILPEQELERGTVVINALEPKVKEILVEGNQHYSRDNVLRSLPTLKMNTTPNIARIAENLKAANENPGRKITLQFKTGETETELSAQIKVKDQKAWKISATTDNTGTSATGEYRVGVGLQHANLFNRDHVVSLQYITSPDHLDKVQIISGSYRIPLYQFGDTLDLFGAYSDVDSGTTQISGTGLSVSGKGIVAGGRYTMNLNRFGDYEHKLTGGIDYRLYDNSILYQGAEYGKDVVAHPLSLTYGSTWKEGIVSLDGSVGLLYNIPWGGQGQKSDFRAVREDATANYLIGRYGLNAMLQPGADMALRFAVTGQYTPDRLISGEQFGLGGASSVRGYAEREESWDAGLGGQLELYSPDLGQMIGVPQTQVRLVGFFDAGYGYNVRPRNGELRDHSLAGSGAGVRLTVAEYLSVSLDWGHALTSSVTTRRGADVLHFKASISY